MVKILLNVMSLRLCSSSYHIKLIQRCLSKETYSAPPSSATAPPVNVPGLSTAVLKIPDGEVGPGATKAGEYKNPEYYSYNPLSYFEAEIEMLKYRCPQPSSKK